MDIFSGDVTVQWCAVLVFLSAVLVYLDAKYNSHRG